MINICFVLSFYLLSSKITVNIYQFLTNDNTPIFRKILKLQKPMTFTSLVFYYIRLSEVKLKTKKTSTFVLAFVYKLLIKVSLRQL